MPRPFVKYVRKTRSTSRRKTLSPKVSPSWYSPTHGVSGETPRSTDKSLSKDEYQGTVQPMRPLNDSI